MSDEDTRVFKVFLVDDHPIVRQGLAQLIAHEPDLEVVGEAEDAPEAMHAMADNVPDVAVVDLFLKSSDGFDLIKRIRAQWPKVAVLVLTMQGQTFYAERALRAGAMGFLNKREASEKVLTAIRQLTRGEMYVSEESSPKLLRRLLGGEADDGEPFIGRLSDRELQVFLLIGHGHGTKQIADDLNLSVKTIETYRSHIKEKLDLGDSRDLIKFAMRWVLTNEGR